MIRRTCSPSFGAKLAFVTALGSLSPWLFAQQQPLDREIAFVRSLAKDMRFIELARIEADELAKNNTSRGGDQEKIAQLAVEIAYYGARSRNDRTQQRTLFKETVTKSKELIETSTSETVKQDARATLANASQDYGQFLTEELDIARETAPDRVKELEEEATQVFRTGIEACTKVMETLKAAAENDEAKKTDYYLMWMKKAVLSREQGRADKQNRSVLCSRAISDLEEMVLEVGEETVIGLRGLFEIAQCREVDGNIPEAIDSYRSTVTQIVTTLDQAQKGELDLPGELQAFLFEMMQEVYVRTGEVMTREGAEGTAELFAEFHKHLTTFGEKGADLLEVASDPHGHLMLLAEARFNAESGDSKKVADALTMAQKINDKHPADYVGVRAKATLRDILALQRGLVSGALLFEVAKGEFQNKNFEEAVKGMRRAIGAMTPEEQQKLGLEAFETLGLAYAYSERYLEAILAFTEGLRKHGAGDSKLAGEVADHADRALSAHKRLTKNDPAFADFYRSASEAIASNSVAAGGKLFWKDANERFNDKKYAEAIALYGKLTPDFLYYEQALVNVGRAHAAGGDFGKAREALAAYRDYAAKTTLPASETGKQQVRAQAQADAEYTEVQIAYVEARGSEEFKIKKDLTKYPAAIERARNFATNFAKDGGRNVAVALEYIGRLNADIGKLDLAESAYADLKQQDPPRASRLATEIFKEYQTQVKALADEYDQSIAKDAPAATQEKARNDLAAAREKLVHLGNDYIANSPKPQLGVLVATMQSWEELGDWKQVETAAQKMLDLYGKETDAGTKRVIDEIARPKLGESLLRQRRFTEAYPMLVEAEKANPLQYELKRLIALALGGWYEIDKSGRGKPELALEKPAEAYEKYWSKDGYRAWGLRPSVQQFDLEWYSYQWELYWFARQAGMKDGKMKEIAERIYRIARSTDDFASLKKHGKKGLELFNFFQSNR